MDARAAAEARRVEVDRAADRLALEVEALRRDGSTWHRAMAEVLTERDVPMPSGPHGLHAHDGGAAPEPHR